MAKESEGHDKALSTGLSNAKRAKADKPCFFAMVLKGTSDGALLVDRKHIAPAKIQEAKKSTGGTTVVRGVCYGDEGKLIFETPKEPAGTWAAAARKIAHESAGVAIAPLFRAGRDPDTVPEPTDEDETAQSEVEQTGTDEAAAQQWAQRLKVIQPKLLAALKANQGDVNKLRAVFAFAQEKAAAHDYTKALTTLDNLEKLLSAPAPGGDGQALSAWQAARENAVKDLKAVAAAVAATKDPDAAKVIIELQGIIKNLTPSPTTPQQIAELERFLADDIVTAAEEVPPEFGTLHIRQPLLAALAKLKA